MKISVTNESMDKYNIEENNVKHYTPTREFNETDDEDVEENKDLAIKPPLVEKHPPKNPQIDVKAVIFPLFEEIFLSGDMHRTKKLLSSAEKGSKYRVFSIIFMTVDIILRGISQVYLCDHTLSGLLIAIALGLSSTELLLHCIVGVASSTASAFLLCRLPYDKISDGLLGYDGALVGCTVWTFMTDGNTTNSVYGGGYLFFVTVLLAAFSGMMHMTCANVLALAKLPPFTVAFNIVCLVMLTIIARENVNSVSFRDSPDNDFHENYTAMSFWFVVDATFRGVGQFIYADTTLGGILVVLGVCMQGRRDAVCLVLGSLVACFSARYLMQVPQSEFVAIRQGLYGYNCAGVCVVLGGGRFYRPTKGAIFLGCVGAVLTVFVQLGLKSTFIVNDIQLPVMTFPFVLTSWIVMYTQSGWIKVKVDKRDDDLENVAPTRQPKSRINRIPSLSQIVQRSFKKSKSASRLIKIKSASNLFSKQ